MCYGRSSSYFPFYLFFSLSSLSFKEADEERRRAKEKEKWLAEKKRLAEEKRLGDIEAEKEKEIQPREDGRRKQRDHEERTEQLHHERLKALIADYSQHRREWATKSSVAQVALLDGEELDRVTHLMRLIQSCPHLEAYYTAYTETLLAFFFKLRLLDSTSLSTMQVSSGVTKGAVKGIAYVIKTILDEIPVVKSATKFTNDAVRAAKGAARILSI